MRNGIAAWLLASSIATGAFAQQPAAPAVDAEMQAALTRPLTPAAVVLLLPYASRPEGVERLALALRHPNAEVRAVAARVAFTTRHQQLVPALTAGLEAESEAVAAAEMARAVALIAGPPSDDAVFRAAPRLDPIVKEAWLEVIARTRPADALTRLPALGDRAGAVLVALAASNGDSVARAFALLGSAPELEPAYAAMIGRAERADVTLPWPVLAIGLEASPASRRQVVGVLLRRQGAGSAVAPQAVPILNELRGRVTAADDPWLVIALELVRRGERPGDSPVPLGPAIAALDPAAAPDSWRLDGFLRRLNRAEEAALRARVPDLPDREAWGAERRPGAPVPPPAIAADPAGEMVTRLVRPLTPRLVAELGALTGCTPASGQVLAVEVAYKPTGQVREVFAPVGTGAARCGLAARLLAAIDIAIGFEPLSATRHDLVLVGFRPEDATCPRVEMKGSPNMIRLGTPRVRAPRRIRNVSPVYPQEMQDRRVEGVVIVEAVIAPTGCVMDATVLRGPHTTLKAAALAAVSAWQYEPTLLDGEPVPVIMTVSVNFTLH